MLNYTLPFLPERTEKPRNTGLTMVMDKGLSVRQAEDLVSMCDDYIDFVKLGFGTSLVSPHLKEKIKVYKKAGIKPYFGGTLFEAFIVRGLFDEFREYVDEYNVDTVEVSDGSMTLLHDQKLEYIRKLAADYTVFSEVGSKQAGVVIPVERWVKMMEDELRSGVYKVITEAREAGNTGIFNSDGSANTELIDDIMQHVNNDFVLWEAPQKSQQVWFIKLLGANVNLGNISPDDVIPLETLRTGLRGDTFLHFLPADLK